MTKDTIQHTTDYDRFSYLGANRDVNEGHVERLSQAFDEFGNLTRVQPILVNEKMQIIDGQHRFEVCKLRGDAVYYTVVSGLNVDDARSMNILHRGWSPEDYAKSYALSGRKAYQDYLQLQEEFEATHTVLLAAINGGNRRGMNKEFRQGNMVIFDIDNTRKLLDIYDSVRELTDIYEVAFYAALFRVQSIEGYDHKQMLKKLAQYGQQLYKPMSKIEDNIRQLEDIYNYHQNIRLRLY